MNYIQSDWAVTFFSFRLGCLSPKQHISSVKTHSSLSKLCFHTGRVKYLFPSSSGGDFIVCLTCTQLLGWDCPLHPPSCSTPLSGAPSQEHENAQPTSLTVTCCILARFVTPSLLFMLQATGMEEDHWREKRKEGSCSHCFALDVMSTKGTGLQVPRAEFF